MEHNCAFQDGHMKFRYRAAAVIIENENVLMVTSDTSDYYYSIGGAVHLGEKAEEAALREVFEEAGIQCEIERLLFIHENFFIENGFENHEISFYFLMKPVDCKSVKPESNSCGYNEYLHWIPIKDLANYKAFPSFFKNELPNISNAVKHIVTDERELAFSLSQ